MNPSIPSSRVLALSFLAFLLGATPLQAQIEGRVLTAEGQPLAAVTVEVWGRGVVFHTGRTDVDGRFSLPDPGGLRVERYVFRHIGFETAIVQRDAFRPGMEVRLGEEAAWVLPGIEATVARDRCPQEDEPRAREIWSAAAAGYNRSTPRRGLGGFYRSETGDVSERDLFGELEAEMATDISMWDSWPAGQRSDQGRTSTLEEMAPSLGYAWERELDGPEWFIGRDRHLNWIYAPLDTRSAHHFVTPTFARMHTFGLGAVTDSEVRIYFCPTGRARGLPSVRGSILVGRDRSMLEADWTFVTDDPREDAGGWVRFSTAADPARGLPHLVVARGIFYRHDGFRKRFPDEPRWYFRERREWTRWIVSTTARRPEPGARTRPGGGR